MNRRRRVRASFLLRGVILGATLLLAAACLLSGWAAVLTVPVLGGLCLVAFFFLPDLLRHFIVRRAIASGRPIDSIWFVELDRISEQEHERFDRQTQDNPTLR